MANNLNEKLFTQEHCAYGLMNAVQDEDGCMIYKKRNTASGYAMFSYGGKNPRERITAIGHRVVYLWYHGAIPYGYDIDHICHNEAVSQGKCDGGSDCKHRACINPEHLRAVPRSDNIKAGAKWSWNNKSVCNNGHNSEIKSRTYRNKNRKSGYTTVRYCTTCYEETYKRNNAKYAERAGA